MMDGIGCSECKNSMKLEVDDYDEEYVFKCIRIESTSI